jgi:hypothetical protein
MMVVGMGQFFPSGYEYGFMCPLGTLPTAIPTRDAGTERNWKKKGTEKNLKKGKKIYQSQVSILGPVGYGPTTLPLRHSDVCGT